MSLSSETLHPLTSSNFQYSFDCEHHDALRTVATRFIPTKKQDRVRPGQSPCTLLFCTGISLRMSLHYFVGLHLTHSNVQSERLGCQ